MLLFKYSIEFVSDIKESFMIVLMFCLSHSATGIFNIKRRETKRARQFNFELRLVRFNLQYDTVFENRDGTTKNIKYHLVCFCLCAIHRLFSRTSNL